MAGTLEPTVFRLFAKDRCSDQCTGIILTPLWFLGHCRELGDIDRSWSLLLIQIVVLVLAIVIISRAGVRCLGRDCGACARLISRTGFGTFNDGLVLTRGRLTLVSSSWRSIAMGHKHTHCNKAMNCFFHDLSSGR